MENPSKLLAWEYRAQAEERQNGEKSVHHK